MNKMKELIQKEFQKPLEDIYEDIFLRVEAFENEKWYDELLIYTHIGVCKPEKEDVEEVRKALKMLGYETEESVYDGEVYLKPKPRERPCQSREEER
ncbi:MAG: hypothetical protein IJW55_06900 [Clostridia bacterium]|nr:hypothetical protein [Clostridia bacterium]